MTKREIAGYIEKAIKAVQKEEKLPYFDIPEILIFPKF